MKTTNLNITIENELNQYFLVQTNRNRQLNLHFHHHRPNTTSDINICILAKGRANVKLDATVTIHETAPGSNARLNILAITTDQAHIAAAPNLEINNNQVRAGHALTTKHIDSQQLYYLTSRGIPLIAAHQLVIDGVIKPYLKGVKL